MGKLVVSIVRFLPLCVVVLALPAIVASQPTPLTVQSVWTQDADGNNKTAFAPGKTIRCVAPLNNSYGGYRLAANRTQLANYKFEQFETIPLFDLFIEVVVDPHMIADWPFAGWDGGDMGPIWLIKAWKQEKPCK